MRAHQASLPTYPVLPTLVPSSPLLVRPARMRWPTLDPLIPDPAPARVPHPAPWRDSLAVVTGHMARVEAWAFLALLTLTLPALAINQSVLWHLLNGGTLDRAIRAFLLAGGQ